MSVTRVTLTSADEKFAPPTQEIDISVISDRVFITVYSGSQEDLKDGRKKAYDVPVLWLKDVLYAVNASAEAFTATHVRTLSK